LEEINYTLTNYLLLNIEAIQIIISITTITEIMPTAAPALKIPPITEQLLKHNNSKMADGVYNFFMLDLFIDIIAKTRN
jgi:hypothetical protein